MFTVNLNGQWDFIADLDPKYHDDRRPYPAHPYSQPDCSRRHWLKAAVPGVWQKYAERYDIYEGVCWFAREFELEKAPTGARLRFGGVNYYCDVYVNGKFIGSHEGGYTEFSLDAAAAVQPGRNHIAVRVDNRATTLKWPHCLGYFNYGGIHRSVALELTEGISIEDVVLSATPYESGWLLNVRAAVAANAGQELALRVSCHNQCMDLTDIDGVFNGQLPIPDAQSWSPEAPALYLVRLELLHGGKPLDCREINYGFKTIEVKDFAIRLNGGLYPIKGVCYVYDSPIHGLVMDRDQIETDARLMKEMGANAVRCHYPMDESFYEVCDALGLLVWIEPPVYCYHPDNDAAGTRFTDAGWLGVAQNMIREMIRTARNHPCAAIYGIGNECNTDNPEAKGFFASLAETVRGEDSTRLVSYAALYGIVGPLADMVDVLGINSYWGWYDKVFGGKGLVPDGSPLSGGLTREPIDLAAMREMLDQVIRGGRKDLVLFLTEFGADSIPGFYAAGRDLWTENYHAELLGEILALSKEYPQIAGTFPFCFTDYRDPSKTMNGYWNELNLKGAVTYNREKKLAFGALRMQYIGK